MKLIIVCVAVLALAGCATIPSDSVDTLKTGIENISRRFDKSLTTTDDKVAIIPISGTAKDGSFGAYFSDTLASKMKEMNPKISVLERNQLEKVLEERNFNYNGTFDQTTINNLRPFIPATYIVSGSYTVFDKYVELNIRMVEVGTGEIKDSIIEQVALDSDVRKLLATSSEDYVAAKPVPAKSLINPKTYWGFSFATLNKFNFIVGYSRYPFDTKFSGSYWGRTYGIEYDNSYAIYKSNDLEHGFTLGIGTARDKDKSNWNYIGAGYYLNYSVFYGKVLLTTGFGSLANPQPELEFGMLFK
jgi:hypothetical protein